MGKTVIRRLSQNVDIKLWQVFLFALGFILIIVGLVLIILWQRGLVQLRWLPCPKQQVPIAYGL